MKHIILFAVAAISAANIYAASPAATQAWVTNYVNGSAVRMINSPTGAVYSCSMCGCSGTFTVEPCDVYALQSQNVTSAAVAAGVTNGMWFVWNEGIHSYTNYTQTITATISNYVWQSHHSVAGEFSGYFDVKAYMIQSSYAKEVVK